MSASGFLFDENLSPAIAAQLRRHAPAIPILAVGQMGAPARGTLDPQILCWIEEHNCLLVTNNRTSMPGHLRDHLADGRHIPGILITPYPLNIGTLIEVLLLVWGASLPDEYRDQITHLSFGR
ncbi:MAG: DUF5615 family PIN-like protein [Chloroflexi bacterium]|nr:DUF5615 family PIN-like protein [Chloroflexota bacterium]